MFNPYSGNTAQQLLQHLYRDYDPMNIQYFFAEQVSSPPRHRHGGAVAHRKWKRARASGRR